MTRCLISPVFIILEQLYHLCLCPVFPGQLFRVRHPQTNGAVERLNQTIQEEFYKVAFRKKLYHSLEEIQADLDEFMTWYNNERTNQGRYCHGRTPMQTFIEGLELYQQYVYDKEVIEAAA